MEIIFHNHIGIFNNAVNTKYCDDLIKLHSTSNLKELRKNVNPKKEIIVNDESISLNTSHYTKFFHHKILDQKILPAYINKYSGYQDLFKDLRIYYDGFNVQKTNPGEGYHMWHSEWHPAQEFFKRALVWTLYLNDIEEGGETEFLDIPFRFKPKKGSVLIFPSHATHLHRGNPPLSGTKYIATGWINVSIKMS